MVLVSRVQAHTDHPMDRNRYITFSDLASIVAFGMVDSYNMPEKLAFFRSLVKSMRLIEERGLATISKILIKARKELSIQLRPPTDQRKSVTHLWSPELDVSLLYVEA